MKKELSSLPALLRERGYKVTPGRVAILKILRDERRPLSAPKIYKKARGLVDQVTVYRTVESLVHAGVVRKVDFHHPHAHYELLEGYAHHHHLVCKRCGTIEDVETCNTKTLEKKVLQKSKSFAVIKNHSLEFFGLCHRCARAESQ